MLTYTAEELQILTAAYLDETGMAPTTLGLVVAGNDKLFTSLRKGNDCTTASAARASYFFDLNWPPTLEWPKQVYRRPMWMIYGDNNRGHQTMQSRTALERNAARARRRKLRQADSAMRAAPAKPVGRARKTATVVASPA